MTDQYRVDFPMFSKSDVYGEKQNSVFRFLQGTEAHVFGVNNIFLLGAARAVVRFEFRPVSHWMFW